MEVLMNKVKMTVAIAAASLVCTGVFADEGGGGKETIPTSVATTQESGNVSILEKLVDLIRATDRGG